VASFKKHEFKNSEQTLRVVYRRVSWAPPVNKSRLRKAFFWTTARRGARGGNQPFPLRVLKKHEFKNSEQSVDFWGLGLVGPKPQKSRYREEFLNEYNRGKESSWERTVRFSFAFKKPRSFKGAGGNSGLMGSQCKKISENSRFLCLEFIFV